MRCESCQTTWYSRVARLIVQNGDLARCVKCQGHLRLVEHHDHAHQVFGQSARSG